MSERRKNDILFGMEKKDKIYMISDTAVSSKAQLNDCSETSFGEVEGLYGTYYVKEEQLKLYKICDDIALSFAGDVEQAKEIVEHIYIWNESMDFLEWKIFLESDCTNKNIDIIIIRSFQGKNSIYKLENGTLVLSERVAIGNGAGEYQINNDINAIVDNTFIQNEDHADYLENVMALIQCYMFKNNTLNKGIGGPVIGVILTTKVRFFRNIEYYFFDDNITKNYSTITLCSRWNSVFSASDSMKGYNAFINHVKDEEIWNDIYNQRAIIKSLDTKKTFYYVFYCKKTNIIVFAKTRDYVQNQWFKRWIRRGNNETKYAYVFNPRFLEFFSSIDRSNISRPLMIMLPIENQSFIEHSKIIEGLNLPKNQLDMDYDLNNIYFKGIKSELFKEVKEQIGIYHNLVMIDFRYFCDAIKEKIDLYRPYINLNIEKIRLSELVKSFMKQIVEDEFDKYLLVFIRDEKKICIDEFDMDDIINRNQNCILIEGCKQFDGAVFDILKNYYLNDKFFHLDKLIIMADDKNTDEILYSFLPKFNFDEENPDILLVRNFNDFTNMYGKIKYIAIDILVVKMLGLSMEEYGLYDSMAYGFMDKNDIEQYKLLMK